MATIGVDRRTDPVANPSPPSYFTIVTAAATTFAAMLVGGGALWLGCDLVEYELTGFDRTVCESHARLLRTLGRLPHCPGGLPRSGVFIQQLAVGITAGRRVKPVSRSVT